MEGFFRVLRPDEVEVRVSQIVEGKGLFLLLYKDARCDMRILDETVGPSRWQREHYECKGNLFCRVGVNFDGEWVWKSDCGTESNTEAKKGEASDSFKRACFNFGIGRELYTAPRIWIPADKCEIKKNGKTGRLACYDRFEVKRMDVSGGTITALEIARKGQVVFSWATNRKEQKQARRIGMDEINAICRKIDGARDKSGADWLGAALEKLGMVPGMELTGDQCESVYGLLASWEKKANG